MGTTNFNLRGVSPEVMIVLKRTAKEQKVSMNMLVLGLIEQGLGVSRKVKKTIHHDLDHLAGKWNEKDKKAFDNNIKGFEKIDEELWL